MAQAPEFVSPYAARIAALMEEEKGLEAAPRQPMFSPEQIAQRQAENQRNRQLGMLGELSGDKPLMGVGSQVLKQAMGEQQRKITEHGEYDPLTGELSVFPEYTKRTKQQKLDRDLSRLNEQEARAQTQWNSDRQRAEDRAALAQITAGQQGTYSDAGVDSKGRPVLRQSKSGGLVVQDDNGNLVPHVGPIRSRSAFEKESKELEGMAGTGEKISSMIQSLQTPEGKAAFGTGLGGAMTSLIPSQWQAPVKEAIYTPEQMTFRAGVLEEGYQIAHKLAGAAMSYGEQIRLNEFTPQPGDSDVTVLSKLRAAQKKYTEIQQRLEAKRTAGAASTGPGPRPPVVPPGTQMPGAAGRRAADGQGAGPVTEYDAQGNRMR